MAILIILCIIAMKTNLFIHKFNLIAMKTNKVRNRELIKSLITDYLTNFRLVTALNDLGFKADRYDVQLGDTIIKLMGLEEKIDDNALQAAFYKHSKKVKTLDITLQSEALEDLVNEIYDWLMKERRKYENTK